jgi:hypothetical protein
VTKLVVAILLAGLTAACGEKASHVSGTPSPSATAGGGHGSGDVLIATALMPQAGQGLLTLYSLSGTRVAHFALDAGTRVLAVAGSRTFIQHAGDHLKAIRRDESIEDLGSLGQSVRWFAANPDGTRWIWSTSDETSNPTHSAVHLGGDGLTAHVVEELTRTATVLGPLSWTRQGAFVQYGPAYGHGGYFPFARANEWSLVEGSVHQMDPVTAHITALPATFGCSFGEMAADGTIICFPGGADVRLVSSTGKTTNIALATPRFNNVGKPSAHRPKQPVRWPAPPESVTPWIPITSQSNTEPTWSQQMVRSLDSGRKAWTPRWAGSRGCPTDRSFSGDALARRAGLRAYTFWTNPGTVPLSVIAANQSGT